MNRLPDLIENYSKRFDTEFKDTLDLISKYKKIAIFRHRVPDFDALGTQLGFKRFIEDNFEGKDIKVVGDDHLKFTPRLFPKMDIVEDEWFNKGDFLAIIVDVSDTDRVSDERVKKAKQIVIFDHHPMKEHYGNIEIVDIDLAAAAELVSIFMINSGLKLSKEAAHYLYIALVGDSGRFLYSSTTSLTFNVAEYLIATGIDINAIYLNMYEITLEDLKIQSYILSHYEVSPQGVAYYVLEDETLRKLNLNQMNAKAYVNLFANIKEINVWCSISEDTIDKCYRVSIRSKKLDISGIANKYQGGGHAQASGAKLNSLNELKRFIDDLDELVIENN